MKKASSGKNSDANFWKLRQFGNKCCPLFILSSSTYIWQDPRIARAYTAQNTKKTHSSLVSLSGYPRSGRGAERMRQGEGRRSRAPKTELERNYLTENSSSENHILRTRRKETPDWTPPKKNDDIIVLDADTPLLPVYFWHLRANDRYIINSVGYRYHYTNTTSSTHTLPYDTVPHHTTNVVHICHTVVPALKTLFLIKETPRYKDTFFSLNMVPRRCTIIRGGYLFHFAPPPQIFLLGQHTAV